MVDMQECTHQVVVSMMMAVVTIMIMNGVNHLNHEKQEKQE